MGQKCGCSDTNQIIAQRELSILIEESTEGEKLSTCLHWLRFSHKFRVPNSSNTFNASRSWGNQVGKAENVTFRMFTISSTVYYIGVQRNLGTYNNLWANPCSLTSLVMLKSFWFILPFKDLLCARRTWWADLCPEVDIDLQVCWPNWGSLAISINSSLICSPNAEEALSLLSLPLPPSKESIELATDKFLEIGVGRNKSGWVIIRCGALGAYMRSEMKKGMWVQAYWTAQDDDKIVDVTGWSFKAHAAHLIQCWHRNRSWK